MTSVFRNSSKIISIPAIIVFSIFTATSISFAQNEAVIVHVSLSPAGSFDAKTNKISGNAYRNGAGYSAQKISVDLNSLTSGIELRDEHMKNKYLEVGKFPNAELMLGNGENGRGNGTLKIRGIEKPVNGTYEVVEGGKVKAKFEISLSDYGISGIRYMGVGVKDKVQITATVPVGAAPAAQPPPAAQPNAPGKPAAVAPAKPTAPPMKAPGR